MARREADRQFGKQIKTERERQGWTQAQMANLLSDYGIPVSSTALAKIEAGTRSISVEEGFAMADLLGVPLETLLGRATPMRTDQRYRLRVLAITAGRLAQQQLDIEHIWTDALQDVTSINLPEEEDSLTLRGRVARDAIRHAHEALTAIPRWIDSREVTPR